MSNGVIAREREVASRSPGRMLSRWKRPAQLVLNYLLAILAWQGMTWVFGDLVFPSPALTAVAVRDIVTNPALTFHILITLYRTILGVIISCVVAMLVVIIVRYVSLTRQFYLDVFYPITRAVPTLSIALLAVVWFKLGTGSVAFVILITVLPIYLIQFWEGLKVIDGTLMEMALVVTRKRRPLLTKIVLPMLVPNLFAGTKLGFSLSYKTALVGELLAATNGMGYMLYFAYQEYKTDYVFGWTAIMMFFVVFFDFYFFDYIERKWLYRWESVA